MAAYTPLSLPNGTTLTAEHLRHVEQGIVGADNERVITLNASSSAQDFLYAYTIYSTESAQVSYSDSDGELCSLIGVQDIGGEPTYYFLKPSKDRHIIVKTNTDTGAVTITKNSVGVIKISLNADAGTLSAEDLLTLSKNPERVVFERDGFYYFAENLSSTTTWYYSCNVYWGANGQIIKRVVEVTTSTGAYKKSDYPYTPITYGAAGDALGLVKSGGDVTIADGVITVKDDSHNHRNYTSTSILPNNSGEVKTKYRVAKKGATGSDFHYYQLCRFQVNNDGNCASVIISGRVGGWTSTNMASINALVWNRGTPSMSVFAIAGDALAMKGGTRPKDSSVWDVCELVLYKQTDNTAILYAKCTYWYVFDFNIEAYQSTTSILYDGNPVTPTGELIASSSTTEKRVEIVAGSLYVNGQLTPLMEDLNLFYTDSQSYADDKLKEATDYTDTRETEIKKYADGKTQEAKRYADEVAAGIVGSAPETLDALNELAAALGNDPNFATTVSNQIGQKASQADLDTVSGDVDALKGQVSGKLDKTTYEASKELALGSNGKVCLGKFGAYDTNITIEINSTTHTTYHATIVIATQNVVSNGTGGTVVCYAYDDADNNITPLISVFRPYGSASRQIEVYADLPGWSKNLVHVQGVALSDGGMTDVLTSVETIPTAIDGKIKVTPVNVLTTNFASKTELSAKANDADLKTVAKTGSYNDLTNKPTIPAAVTVDSALSSTSTNPVQNKVINSALAGKANANEVVKLSDNPLTLSTQSSYDCNTCYDGKVWLIAGGNNVPSGAKFGALFTMPYRKASGNQSPDFAGQIFIPNGDDPTKPNSMFYRTALGGSWNPWQEVATVAQLSGYVTNTKLEQVLGSYVNEIDALLGG